jgi:hypothetical protein
VGHLLSTSTRHCMSVDYMTYINVPQVTFMALLRTDSDQWLNKGMADLDLFPDSLPWVSSRAACACSDRAPGKGEEVVCLRIVSSE